MRLHALLLTLIFGLAACTRNNPAAPTAPPTPAAPAKNRYSPEGTSSLGGGGNGINGVAIESYANTSIESLPEYRRHIQPLLRKLSTGKPDVLVAYLQWAVRNKAWYFVPVKLENLPKKKVQLTFRSDQLALHGENEIFIEKEAYDNSTPLDRANLLLHEMVMAARLLMKKSPQAQCEALTKSTDLDACRDPSMLKLATPLVLGANDDIHSLNGVDHEAVRALTVFLADNKQDHSGAAVFAQRVRLSYVFPWDSLLSKISYSELTQLFERSELAHDQFRTEDKLCLMIKSGSGPQMSSWFFAFAATTSPSHQLPPTINGGLKGFPWVVDNKLIDRSAFNFTVFENGATAAHFQTRGTPDAVFGGGAIVDLVEIFPATDDPAAIAYPKTEFFISRNQPAQLLGFRLKWVRGLVKQQGIQLERPWKEIEWVADKSQPTVECRLVN